VSAVVAAATLLLVGIAVALAPGLALGPAPTPAAATPGVFPSPDAGPPAPLRRVRATEPALAEPEPALEADVAALRERVWQLEQELAATAAEADQGYEDLTESVDRLNARP
jgi:hypothetical protein